MCHVYAYPHSNVSYNEKAIRLGLRETKCANSVNKWVKEIFKAWLYINMSECIQQNTLSLCLNDYYLSFFCKACFSEPLTMYSVTVAKVPPGPSGTIP